MKKIEHIITGLRVVSAIVWCWSILAMNYIVHGQIDAYPRLLWGRVIVATLFAISITPTRLLLRNRLVYWACLSMASGVSLVACFAIISGISSALHKPSYDTLDSILKVVVPIMGLLCVGCLPASLLMMRYWVVGSDNSKRESQQTAAASPSVGPQKVDGQYPQRLIRDVRPNND